MNNNLNNELQKLEDDYKTFEKNSIQEYENIQKNKKYFMTSLDNIYLETMKTIKEDNGIYKQQFQNELNNIKQEGLYICQKRINKIENELQQKKREYIKNMENIQNKIKEEDKNG